jgi:hypothetical protein
VEEVGRPPGLSERAKEKGIEIGELVNVLLKRDIEMIEAAS